MGPTLRIHAFLPFSSANGPGLRAGIWVQGCTLNCPGCFNPETHTTAGGRDISVSELLTSLIALAPLLEGLTLSGGEPLQQFDAVLALLSQLQSVTTLSTIVSTGYTWEEIQKMAKSSELLACVDVLITGRYDVSNHLGRTLAGSRNKKIQFLTNRYTLKDLEEVPETEIFITSEGKVMVSGIDPLRFNKEVPSQCPILAASARR